MYHVVTVNLNNKSISKKRWKTLAAQNPKMAQGCQTAQSLILTSDKTLTQCFNGDFSWSKSGWTKNATTVVKEYCKSFESKIEAYECREVFIEKMRERGWGVFYDNPKNCRIYIIELENSAWGFSNFKDKNKSVKNKTPKLVYVGETSKPVVDRFEEHKKSVNGKKGPLASEIVFFHGICLDYALMKPFENKLYTKLDALKKEKEVGENLRTKGIATWFN